MHVISNTITYSNTAKISLLYYLIVEPILTPLSSDLSLYICMNMANPTPTITSITSCSYYLSLNLLFN
jgi:hypothetical protein